MPEARPYCATAPDRVRSVFNMTREPERRRFEMEIDRRVGAAAALGILALRLHARLCAASSMSVNFTWPANVSATGPSLTETFPA